MTSFFSFLSKMQINIEISTDFSFVSHISMNCLYACSYDLHLSCPSTFLKKWSNSWSFCKNRRRRILIKPLLPTHLPLSLLVAQLTTPCCPTLTPHPVRQRLKILSFVKLDMMVTCSVLDGPRKNINNMTFKQKQNTLIAPCPHFVNASHLCNHTLRKEYVHEPSFKLSGSYICSFPY